MRRGTTPTITLTVSNEDGSPCDLTTQEVYVTFDDGQRQFTKRENEVSMAFDGKETTIGITLTQAETLRFKVGKRVRVQVRCKAMGIAQATTIDSFDPEEILLEGEI